MALGAQRKSILFMILGEGALMAAIGLALGAIAAIPLSQLISGLLFDVRPVDPPTIVFAAFYLSSSPSQRPWSRPGAPRLSIQ